jgi:hypothetical protein
LEEILASEKKAERLERLISAGCQVDPFSAVRFDNRVAGRPPGTDQKFFNLTICTKKKAEIAKRQKR